MLPKIVSFLPVSAETLVKIKKRVISGWGTSRDFQPEIKKHAMGTFKMPILCVRVWTKTHPTPLIEISLEVFLGQNFKTMP